jgi:hypothetical protein
MEEQKAIKAARIAVMDTMTVKQIREFLDAAAERVTAMPKDPDDLSFEEYGEQDAWHDVHKLEDAIWNLEHDYNNVVDMMERTNVA